MHFNKIKYTIALFCLAISGFFTVSSCTHEPDKVEIKVPEPLPPCDANKVYFVNDVMPYINSTCAVPGCHDNKGPAAFIDLSNYVI